MFKNMIKWLNKKGQVASAKVNYLFGALVVIIFATALAPTMFEAVANLTGVTGVPTWMTTLLPIVIAMGLVFLIWRAISGSK